jgi:hypothetical protein
VNTDNLTIEDVLDMSERERDRVAAEWMDELEVKRVESIVSHYEYHKHWRHAGRLLEALPSSFSISPAGWFRGKGHFQVEDSLVQNPLSKQSIVLAACICAVRGVEPRGGE